MSYFTIFSRLIIRPLRKDPIRTSLTLLAVALGVAVVLAIELAGDAAAGSFQSSVETLTGHADFEVTADGGIRPAVLTRLALLPYPLKLRPRIEDYAVVVPSGKTVPFIGVDVLADANVPEQTSGPAKQEDVKLSSHDSVFAGQTLGWHLGDHVRLLLNDTESEFTVRGLLPDSAGDVIAMDLGGATAALHRISGSLDRILVEMASGLDARDVERAVQGAVGNQAVVSPFGSRTEENRRMLAAFRWNLRVLSYIALVVGAFLIYNTISVSVVRRRTEIGILRALGATRLGVLAAFLGEALWFGVVGGVTGILLGRVLATTAVRLIATTVDALYVSSRPGEIALTPMVALFAIAMGAGVSVFSAFGPAWSAALIPPAEAMGRGRVEHEARIHVRRNLLVAAVLLTTAALASRQPAVAGKPVYGYLAAMCLIGALAAGISPLVAMFSRVTSSGMRSLFGVEGLLASRSILGSLRRTSVLAGALATAIAMTTAVGIMVGSFRETVLLWMNERLKADLFVRPAGPASADRHPTMAADAVDRVRVLPEIEAVDLVRAYPITYEGQPATLAGGDSRVQSRFGNRRFASGRDVFRQLVSEQDTAIVSEPFANKHNVHAGDVLTLRLGDHDARLRVLDIYADYASERGYVVVDRRTLLKYLPDPAPSNIAAYLRPGVSIEEGKRAVEQALSGRRVLVLTNRTLRQEAIKTFDRTFAITYALEGVAVVVAIMGVAGALLALVIDRRREFGLLRFLGSATGQIRRLILFEAGLLGLLANIAGFGLGILLSLLLIFVINKQSFGWTIQFHWPIAVLIGALSAVFGATVLSALYPARVATRLNPIEAVHEE